jgi:hypothetical protein
VKLLPLEAHGVLTSGRRGFLRSEFDQNALIFTFEPDIVIPYLLDQTPFALWLQIFRGLMHMTTISRPCLTFHQRSKGFPGCELNGSQNRKRIATATGNPVPCLYDRPGVPLTICLILFKMYGKYRFHQTQLHENLRMIILWQDITLMSRNADKGL